MELYIYVYIRIYHRNIFDPYRKRFRDVTCGSSLDTKISILVRPLVTHATLRIYSTSIVIRLVEGKCKTLKMNISNKNLKVLEYEKNN